MNFEPRRVNGYRLGTGDGRCMVFAGWLPHSDVIPESVELHCGDRIYRLDERGEFETGPGTGLHDTTNYHSRTREFAIFFEDLI